MEQAYVYMWTEIATDMWYIGSRTKKGCHPDDGYICSSKTVKPKIKSNPDGWTRKLLYVGDSFKAFEIESFVLKEMRAKQSEMSYNLHNQDMNFHGIRKPQTEENKKKLSALFKGRVSPNKGNVCPKVGESNKKRIGIKRPEHSEWMTGRTWNCVEKICPQCGAFGSGGNMLRYHFDNCKNPQQYLFKE
jgi:hypothetical protein